MVFKVRYLFTLYEAAKPPFRLRFGQPATPVNLWGFARTREDVEKERAIVEKELEDLKRKSPFEIEFAGGDIISTEFEVFDISKELGEADAILVYGTTDFANILDAVTAFNLPTIVFIKVYRGENLYEQAEVINPRFLRGETDQIVIKDPDIYVIFDDYDRLLRVLTAMNAVKKTRNTRVLCLGVPYGWQFRYREVRAAQRKLGLKVDYVTYSEFTEFMRRASEEQKIRSKAEKMATEMLDKALKVVEPSKEDLVKAATAYLVVEELVKDRDINAVTVSDCFSAFPSITGTPACMILSKLNDQRIVAGCEGDFNALSAQLLLSYVSDRPVCFLDPIVHPEANKVIVAHCTSPLLMEGYEGQKRPYILRSQDSSNAGVSVQLVHPEGQEVTLADPSFDLEKIVVTKGKILRNTDYPVCRNQLEVEVPDSKKLWENWVGFHWVMVYGDYVEEIQEACKMLGIECIVV